MVTRLSFSPQLMAPVFANGAFLNGFGALCP